VINANSQFTRTVVAPVYSHTSIHSVNTNN